ncbi:hypothetical protein POTOM_055703 [Populus tomentosa]|uniref:Uncharacterized protein n=1 Tax=Populus tomentosa TaxID=118781 RepID=A0A8X7XZP5_POPTO|nr:hypothetical protein POTOM_055703 [Populus tomentosa]
MGSPGKENQRDSIRMLSSPLGFTTRVSDAMAIPLVDSVFVLAGISFLLWDTVSVAWHPWKFFISPLYTLLEIWMSLGKAKGRDSSLEKSRGEGVKTGQNRPPSVQVQDFLVEIQWPEFLIFKVSSNYSFVHNE